MSFIKTSGHLEISGSGGSSPYTVGGGGGGGNGSLGSGASGGSGGGGTSPGGTVITAVGAERRETWATPTMVTTLKIGALPREPEKFAQLKYNIVKLHKHLRQLVKSSEELSKAREDLYMKEQQWIMDMVDFNVHHGIEAGYATTNLTNALKQVSKARYRDAVDVRSQVMTTLKNFLNGDVAEAMHMIRNLEAARERFENASSKFSSISSSTNVGKFTKLETEVAESKQHYESTYNTAVLKLIEADSKKMNTVLEQYYNFYASFLTFAKEEEAIFRSLEPEMKTWKETFENNKSLGAEEDTLIYEQVQLQHDTVEGIGNGEPSKTNTEKKGYIFKKNAKGWKCSWFVLQKGILVHYRSFKDPEPEGSLSLLLCTVKEVPSEKSFCFEVISPEERMLLRATNAEEYAEWIKVLQHSIALQLTDSGREDESDYFGGGVAGIGGAHITSASGLVALLREVAGNQACADCQQQDPEWAVLNMGILICVRCSGIHRGLGVHVSKVRSLALDKWERQQIEVMKLIGNKRANETLWETKVPEEWQTKRATPDGENKVVEAWIKTKYVAKSFMVKASGSADELGQRLWAATREKDYVEVLRLIASGADPNWPNQEEEHRTILHTILSYNNDMVDGENNNTNNSYTSSNSASAAVALELLLQNGGDINAKDDNGRTPLHYCALYGQVECAKVLWNKGAKLCKDGEGRSPTEVAEAHGQEVCAALMKSFEGEISQGEEMKRRSNTTSAGMEGLVELGTVNNGSNSRMGKDLRKKRNKTLSTTSGSALAASLSGVGGGSQLFFDKTFASSSSSISTSPSASNVSSPSAGSSPSLLTSSGSGSGGGSSTKPHLLSKIKGVTLRKKKGMISPYVQAAMAAGDGNNSGSHGERSPGEEPSSSLPELNNFHSSSPSSSVTIITPEATGTMESLTRTARALSEEEPTSSSLSDCPAPSPSGGRHKKRGISIHQSLRRHRVHSGDTIVHHPSSSLSTDASASLPTSALGGIDSDTDTDIAYVNNRGELVLDGRSASDVEDEFLTGGVHDEEGEESFSNESSHSASPSLPVPPPTATKRNKNSSPRWSRATKPATWTKKTPIPSIMKSPRRTPSFESKEQTKKKAETDASDQTDSGSESSKEQKHKKKKKVKRKGSGGSGGVEKETSTPFPGIRHHDLTSSLLQLDTSPLSFDVGPSDATTPKNHKKKEKRTKRKGEKDKSDSSKRKSLAPTSATATALHQVLVGPELGNSPLQLRRTVSQPSEVHAKIVTSSPSASSSSKPTTSSKLAWRRSKEIKNNEGGTSSGEGEGRRPTKNGEEPMLGAERRREEPMEQQPPEDSG